MGINENKMYEYLEEHAYISKNKKSNYQFELTKERAECIANKYNSLVGEKDEEIKKLQTILRTRARQDRKRKAKLRKLRLEITNQRLKLERLNNIINEIEKDLDKQLGFCINEANGTINGKYCRIAINYLKHLKSKLQKLKGDEHDV